MKRKGVQKEISDRIRRGIRKAKSNRSDVVHQYRHKMDYETDYPKSFDKSFESRFFEELEKLRKEDLNPNGK